MNMGSSLVMILGLVLAVLAVVTVVIVFIVRHFTRRDDN
jgi:hypothetical protein